MRDPKRIEPILDALRRVWAANPDLRLTQLVVNAARTGVPCPELFSLEDDVLFARLTALVGESAKPATAVGEQLTSGDVAGRGPG